MNSFGPIARKACSLSPSITRPSTRSRPASPKASQKPCAPPRPTPKSTPIIVTGAGRTFVAGADIKELGRIVAGERPMIDLNPLFNEIEDSAKTVIMALHGTALGGGLELALAGHYRIAYADTRLGQPEVKLGLIPGAGGTQRLPRLVGLEAALDLCVFGEPVNARRALQLGLVDAVVTDLLDAALAFARARPRPRRTRDKSVKPLDPAGPRPRRSRRRRVEPPPAPSNRAPRRRRGGLGRGRSAL